MKKKPTFTNPVQTAPALEKATGVDRSLFTRGANKGHFGASAYRSGDSWLFDTAHPDFDRWWVAHWEQPRAKGERKKREAGSTMA